MPKWEVDTDTIISEYKMEQDECVEEETQEENISDGNPIIAEKFYKALRIFFG